MISNRFKVNWAFQALLLISTLGKCVETNKIFLLSLFFIFQYLIYLYKKGIAFTATPTISVSPSSVTVLVGQPTTITCTAYLVFTADIVWQASSTTVWINNNFLSTFGLQYAVSSAFNPNTQTTTSNLTVLSVSSTATISYQCGCNIYTSVTGCTAATIGTSSVSGFTTTTTTTTSTTTSTTPTTTGKFEF